ncbi:hypothetical protein [Tropicimonas sediminicola]|uniref:Uncharacterized protein n=1 Tax=Tropicimonas sediminicola TaxID=1031541 RepID=A0A239KUN1_9RHOB|nr:hypothetical protein [Tropicimonas sediminicola]SNT21730.1 hypothetical protein SAMN05421757_10824 [Tropicimonas sediminicola]
MEDHSIEKNEALVSPARRRLLAKAGTYAVVTPPAVSFMLSTALAGDSVAKSGGGDQPWKQRWQERKAQQKLARKAANKEARRAAKKAANKAARKAARKAAKN